MISQKTIEEVKARASLLDIVGDTVQLKRQGSSYVGLCPFHGERSASFHVRDNEQYFHCFGCGKSGNAFTYLMESRGLSFPEAVEELAERYGITVEKTGLSQGKNTTGNTKDIYTLNQKAYQFFKAELAKRDPAVVAYAKERRLTKESVQAFGLGFAPLGNGFIQFARREKLPEELLVTSGLARRNARGDLYDSLRGRLVFPIFIDPKRIGGFGGRTIPALQEKDSTAPKYLNSPETPVYHKSSVLYGLPQAMAAIKEQGRVFVVEGYMDVIGLWQAGVRNVVATCGTALTEEHVKKLSRITKTIILLFDGDVAGRAAAAKSFLTFLNSSVDVWAVYLDEKEDPDTIAIQYGDKTAHYLDSLAKVPLIDAYIESQLKQYGVSSVDELGASSRGSFASSIAGVLAKVKDSITRMELGKRAAIKMKIPFERFESIIPEQGASKEVHAPAIPEEKEEVIEQFKDLPRLDQSVLHLAMGKKEEYLPKILKSGILFEVVHPVTRGFLETLRDIMRREQDEVARKEDVKSLLKAYGPTWTAQWKVAHEIFLERNSNPQRQLEDCVLQAQKSVLQSQLEKKNRQVSEAIDQAQKESLLQEVVELKKQHQALSARAGAPAV